MDVVAEASLTLELPTGRWYLIVGTPGSDGTTPCHLLGDDPSAGGFTTLLDLAGRLHGTRALPGDVPGTPEMLAQILAVDPALWRTGLAVGLRRRLGVLRQVRAESGTVAALLDRRIRILDAQVAAAECLDPELQPAMAALARTWVGSAPALRVAAEQAAAGHAHPQQGTVPIGRRVDPGARATAVRRYPWADRLDDEDLAGFLAELDDPTTTAWPDTARQHHARVVTAYWQARAEGDAP